MREHEKEGAGARAGLGAGGAGDAARRGLSHGVVPRSDMGNVPAPESANAEEGPGLLNEMPV